MSKPAPMYTQVRLLRGTTTLTIWIPSQFAARNRYLKLKMGGAWVDGWKVVSCGAEQSEDYLKLHGYGRRDVDDR